MATLEMINRGNVLWVAVVVSDGRVYRYAGSGGILRGGTGSWLLSLTLDLGSRDGVVP